MNVREHPESAGDLKNCAADLTGCCKVPETDFAIADLKMQIHVSLEFKTWMQLSPRKLVLAAVGFWLLVMIKILLL